MIDGDGVGYVDAIVGEGGPADIRLNESDVVGDSPFAVDVDHLWLELHRIHQAGREAGDDVRVEAGAAPQVRNVLVSPEVEQAAEGFRVHLGLQTSGIVEAAGLVVVENSIIHPESSSSLEHRRAVRGRASREHAVRPRDRSAPKLLHAAGSGEG